MADVSIHNLSEIPPEWIASVVDGADLPDGKVLIVLGERRPEGNESFGECVPKAYLATAGRTTLKVARYRTLDWDVGIVLYDRATDQYSSAPAFFAYLLGHELAHAAACLIDPLVHVQYCLLQETIRTASKDAIKQWQDLPHERWCDEFGATIAAQVCGRENLEADLRARISASTGDAFRCQKILELPDRRSMAGLRREIAEFSRPYRSELVALLNQRRRQAELANAECLTRAVSDLHDLFV